MKPLLCLRPAHFLLTLLLAAPLAGGALTACSDLPGFTDTDEDDDGDGDGNGSATGGRGGLDGGNLGGGGNDDDDDDDPIDPTGKCGNGQFEEGELCDDGNTKSGDGCSSDCREVDPDFLCLEAGDPCERVVTCGNSVLEGTERCDDGNEAPSDGCAEDCKSVEAGFVCVKPGEECVRLPVCGNGIRERGEQCDDNESVPDGGDGCDASCQLEPGYFCPPGEACIPLDCGDGVRTPDEQCDDGNEGSGDGCSPVCTVEDGFRCSSSGCAPICGNGRRDGAENDTGRCDDGNLTSGDGCSSACRVEPFWTCTSAEPSVCTSDIVCGDGSVDPGEVCDWAIAGQEACYREADYPGLGCKGFDKDLVDPPVCGNAVIELDEDCDGDQVNGNTAGGGCTACALDDGYECPRAGYCFRVPACGDGLLQSGEECDPGAVSAIGCVDCEVQPNWYCSGEPSVCVASVCGDAFRAPDEQCDDGPGTLGSPGTAVSNDGCSASCTVESGWVCPPSGSCQPECGDGARTGSEQCDSPDTNGCVNCRLVPGWICGAGGTATTCTQTVCPNSVKETGEGCDDGNAIAGDGCGPTCQLEPSVTRTADPTYPGQYIPVVNVTCGDGLKVGSEGCDDGNTTSGDGCSASCAVESGWTCSDVSVSYPSFVDFKITYRDFKQRTQAGGHPHMKRQGINPPNSGLDLGIVGPVCTTGTFGSCGRLDVDGKPVYDSSVTNATIDSDSFDGTQHGQWFSLWYRDSNPNGYLAMSATDNVLGTAPVEICPNPAPGDTCAGTSTTDTLRLSRVGTTSAYQFSSASNDFYPLGHSTLPRTERGFGYTLTTDNTAEASYSGSNRNFHFTSELRYFFKYKGGETLTFYGDDDVWVFVNGRLAVDIGGIHSQEWGRVILGDESGDCTQNGGGTEPTDTTCYTTTEQADATDGRFGIEKGNAYEIVVFQAERHPTGSNYRLTLDGFLSPRSTCETDCGDGIRAGTEVCDEGGSMPASGYDVCLSGVCTFQFCGDGDVYSGEEDCDSPGSFATYQSSAPGACGFDCQRTGYCGDGIVQSAFEVCDDGINDGRYLGCEPGCQALGPYCGDGNSDDDVGVDINGDLLVNSNDDEQCDTPGAFDTYAAASPGACGFNCRRTGYCGDNIRNGPELCDGSLGCNDNCEFDPFCGDGLKTSDEQCDYGVDFDFEGAPEDAPYGGCTDSCLLGPRCGDELVQASVGEECDDGTSNVDGEYNACDTSCLRGPRCGDGIEQSIFGEDCDNGFNEDDYAYPGAVDSCAPGCEDVPFCGDAAVQSAYELCDDGDANSDGAYDGCTTSCEWGPYCGDGLPNGSEECDDGVDNVAYSPTGDGCSYQCSDDVPYCGDGVRNGPEQCDLGTDANNGEYGGCEADCTRAPYCGDDIIQAEEGEACDDGPSGSSACTQSCTARSVVK